MWILVAQELCHIQVEKSDLRPKTHFMAQVQRALVVTLSFVQPAQHCCRLTEQTAETHYRVPGLKSACERRQPAEERLRSRGVMASNADLEKAGEDENSAFVVTRFHVAKASADLTCLVTAV